MYNVRYVGRCGRWSFKVIEIGIECIFLLVFHCNYASFFYLSNNNDYWSKIYFFAAFTNPSLVWSSRKKFSPVTYVTKFDLKSCIPLLPDGKNRIVVRSLILTHCHSAKDRQTDTPLMAKARVCITDARQNTRFCRITPKGNKMHAIMTIVWWYVSQPTSTWVLYCLKRCKIAASRKPFIPACRSHASINTAYLQTYAYAYSAESGVTLRQCQSTHAADRAAS